MSVFITAGTHFGHDGIIQFCERPFASVEHMDRSMVEICNSVVLPRDEVWHVGDFGHGWKATDDGLRRIFTALNGSKHLVVRNHDGAAPFNLPWASIHERNVLRHVRHDCQTLVLDCYSLWTWYGAHHGSFNLYGHVHAASHVCR